MLAQTERMFLRLTFWQTVLSVAGVIIAVVALYAALTESAAVREQTAAAVWPYVQLSTADSDTGEMAHFAISFTNTGVGPARMRSVRALIEGEPVTDWTAAIERLDGEHVQEREPGEGDELRRPPRPAALSVRARPMRSRAGDFRRHAPGRRFDPRSDPRPGPRPVPRAGPRPAGPER